MRRLCLIAAVLALAGCGEQRTRPRDIRHAVAPKGTRESKVAGISFQRPVNWGSLDAKPPLEGGISSSTATVAVWRYPRTEPLPADDAALAQARTALLDRIRGRNPTFAVRTSELTRLGRARAIQLVGRQTVAGFEYDVRSLHVFQDGAEIVVDAYAPVDDFERVDRTVFGPLFASLKIGRP